MQKFIIRGFTVLCAVTTYFITGLVSFPSEIKLMEGRDRNLQFTLPVTASIEQESVGVLSISDKPVESNIKISSENNSITLHPEGSGTAVMNLQAFGFPLKNVILDILPETEVIPWGSTVGVRINTDGILVLGTGYVTDIDGIAHNPCEGLLKSGDLILEANGQLLSNKSKFIEVVQEADEYVNLKIKRGENILEQSIKPVKSMEDKENKLGVWVRDSTQGIGTVTYFNPESKIFAALGHGILDIDTKQLMVIKNGSIMNAEISTVKKGKKGTPGELVGDIHRDEIIGEVKKNTAFGVYGTIEDSKLLKSEQEKVKIALQDKVHEGPAKIRSNVYKDEIKEYDVYIESVNRYSSDDSKGMVIKITDPELLEATNGIVQGMSGSPIIQDNSLIGAVTHVFVQDPTKGYGIFIENMLKQEKAI